jgi:YbbR domain-containing protein
MAFPDYILHNFWWKLLSLLLAALTWLTIETAFQKDQNLRDSPVTTFSRRGFAAVPVTVLTSLRNTNEFKVDPVTVAVEVGGAFADLSKIQPQDIKAFVDVTEPAAEKQFRRSIQAQVPKDLKVVEIIPASASVQRITVPN